MHEKVLQSFVDSTLLNPGSLLMLITLGYNWQFHICSALFLFFFLFFALTPFKIFSGKKPNRYIRIGSGENQNTKPWNEEFHSVNLVSFPWEFNYCIGFYLFHWAFTEKTLAIMNYHLDTWPFCYFMFIWNHFKDFNRDFFFCSISLPFVGKFRYFT